MMSGVKTNKPINSSKNQKKSNASDKLNLVNESFSELSTQLLNEINEIRKNPCSVIIALEERLKNSNGKLINDIEDSIRFIKSIESDLKPFDVSNLLTKIAMEHAQDIGANNLFSHEGSDGYNLLDRLDRCTDWSGSLSENIEFNCKNAQEIVMNWIIDFGSSNKVYRSNLFSPKFRFIGIGISFHETEEIVVVTDFIECIIPQQSDLTKYSTKESVSIFNFKGQNPKLPSSYKYYDEAAPEGTAKLLKIVTNQITLINQTSDQKSINKQKNLKSRKIKTTYYDIEDKVLLTTLKNI